MARRARRLGEPAPTAQRPVGRRMAPAEAADQIVRAAARRQRDLVLTAVGKASWWCSRLAPRLYEALMRSTQRHELERARARQKPA